MCSEVGEEMVKAFEGRKFGPDALLCRSLRIQGIVAALINSVLKDWGCECIFFFNYNRINAGVSNDNVKSHMDALFGQERGDKLRQKLERLSPDDREMMVIEEICEALIEMGGKYRCHSAFETRRDPARAII